jgi:hypothetical protein
LAALHRPSGQPRHAQTTPSNRCRVPGTYDRAVGSRWTGRVFGRSSTDQAPPAAPLALTEAFFDMDKRQTIAEAAVSASEQLYPERQLRQQWDPVVHICYAATSAYLSVTGEPDIAPPTGAPPQPGLNPFDATRNQLNAASHAIDEFYHAHRTHLEQAQAALSAVPAAAQQAAATANAVRHQLVDDGARFADYPSVRAAGSELDQAVTGLDRATAAGGAKAIRDATARVHTAAAELQRALGEAPSQDRLARQSLASVTTRIAAISTRAEQLPPAFSSLLREFNAASSADLTDNERSSQLIMARAAAELTRAQAALAQGNPELARELTSSVRAHLSAAEELVDAVSDRLTLLRAVRVNPRAKEDEVRFKLRDAQMLAVSRGLVDEWASVLDAQVERIDRVAGQLNGRNPDYWGYVSGLETVSAFISGVVQRMRTQSPGSGVS